MSTARKSYPSDVNDEEWAFVAPYLTLMDADAPRRRHDLREVYDALRWIVRTGSARRYLPHDLPPWKTVYHYFCAWRLDGTWERVHDALRTKVRVADGRHPSPSAVILDSQSVKTTEKGGPAAMTRARK